jgi:tRNA U34 5-methylaminomethyl-2-thiouridine-forming methyltransferase MnmC
MQKEAHPVGDGFTYELTALANGTMSVRSLADGETFHPVVGPIAEAEALYVEQLGLRQRLATAGRELVIWDVGLGAGGNACTALRRLGEQDVSGRVRLISFDRTFEALRFALQHAEALIYPAGFEEAIEELLEQHRVRFKHGGLDIEWQVHAGDFPAFISEAASGARPLPSPDVIFFDAYSPARNPGMWTLPLFKNVFRCLEPRRSCALATYSRSTIARVSLLLAGFFVGAGDPIAEKEETTIAANDLALIEHPLNARWLQRARASHSAEPLHSDKYRIAPLAPETWERLRNHPQFGGGSATVPL